MPGPRAQADQGDISQSHRAGSYVGSKPRRQRGDDILDQEESPEATWLLGDLHPDPPSVSGRSAGHRLLPRRRGNLELLCRVAVGQCRVQDLQVPTIVQPVPKYLRTRADRCRSICRGAISDEGPQYVSELYAIRPSQLATGSRARHSANRDISCCARAIRRGIYTMRDTRFLHRALAGTALRKFQPILYVPPAISNFNHHIRIHSDYYLSKSEKFQNGTNEDVQK